MPALSAVSALSPRPTNMCGPNAVQAAEQALAGGQVALAKELAATARSHALAASSARRRANQSAFRRAQCEGGGGGGPGAPFWRGSRPCGRLVPVPLHS